MFKEDLMDKTVHRTFYPFIIVRLYYTVSVGKGLYRQNPKNMFEKINTFVEVLWR